MGARRFAQDNEQKEVEHSIVAMARVPVEERPFRAVFRVQIQRALALVQRLAGYANPETIQNA